MADRLPKGHTAIIKRWGGRLKALLLGVAEFILPVRLARKWGVIPPREASAWYPKKQTQRGMTLRTSTQWILSVGSFLLAAWVSVDGRDGITPSTAHFITAPFVDGLRWTGVDWSTVFFWIFALVWIRALFIRLREEDRAEERYREDLMGALYSLPNFNVLWNYHRYFDQVAAAALRADRQATTHELGEDVKFALAVIAEMSKVFSRSDAEAYGASIMLVIRKEDIPRLPAEYRTPHVEDPAHGRLRFAGDRPNVNAFDGLLVLPSDLALPSIEGDGLPTKTYPLIGLPIRYAPANLVLPGAPRAVLDDQISVYRDARLLADEHCQAFSEPTREEIRAYFAPGGDGGSIRSFASIRIGSDRDPVGVLNIDTDGTDVLGTDEDYYKTFYALLRPILRLLEPLVSAYAVAWWDAVAPQNQLDLPLEPAVAQGDTAQAAHAV